MTEAFLEALHADPWTKSLVDLPELNRDVSSLIEGRVHHLRAVAQEHPAQLRSEALVILGPPGTGKTHLFARVRKGLGPRAVFVHVRPLLHTGLTAGHVLSEAVAQLAQPSFGRDEWQVEAMVGSLIGHVEGRGGDFPTAHLSAFQTLTRDALTQRLDEILEELLRRLPDLDDVFLERLLRIPFVPPRQKRALLAWMTGKDCDPSQLSRIGAASSMNPENVIRAFRTLTSAAALGAPLVLVFDQLENLIQRDATEERVTQYGNLIAELVDSTRGLLVVQMALDSEWEQGIAPRLNLSQQSRVMMKKVSAELPSPKQRRELLELWHGGLDAREHAFPWPFTSEQVEQLTALPGVTPRMLLSAFKEAREGGSPSLLREPSVTGAVGEIEPALNAEELSRVLAEEWHAQLVAAHALLDDAEGQRAGVDPDRLCDGLLLASEFASGAELRGVNDAYIPLLPRAAGGRWVCLLHQAHHRSIGAALERVLAQETTSPGLLLREQRRPLLPTWKSTNQLLIEAITRPHIAWHELTREEVASLLALEAIVQTARSGDICDPRGKPISEREVLGFLREEIHPERWTVTTKLRVATAGEAPRPDPSPTERAEESAPAHETSLADTVAGLGSPAGHEVPNDDLTVEIEAVLQRLRVASIERVIREVARLRTDAGRGTVMVGLERAGERVRWFGRNLVAWGDRS